MSERSEVYRKEFIFDIDTKQGDKYFGNYRKIKSRKHIVCGISFRPKYKALLKLICRGS